MNQSSSEHRYAHKPLSFNSAYIEKDKIERQELGQKIHEDDNKVLLEKFRIGADIQKKHNSLFWYRISIFFVITGALFAGNGVASTEIIKHNSLPPEVTSIILMLVIFGVAGSVLSWFWLQMHKRATFLHNYYRFRASEIEKCIKVNSEIFGESYRIASKDEALKQEWEKIYGPEWKKIFKELVGEEWKDGGRNRVPGSHEKKLDWVYKVFIIVWILLSLGGVAMLSRTLTS